MSALSGPSHIDRTGMYNPDMYCELHRLSEAKVGIREDAAEIKPS